jgi:hypothetical protein
MIMATRKKQPHFLSYTIEHVFGMLFMMSVAIFLGYGAYAADTTTGSASSTLLSSYTLIPPVLTVTSVAPGRISLSWTTATIPGTAQGFMLYRSGANIANLTIASYEDSSSLVPGATYEYYVKTMDTSGAQSAPSNTVIVTLPLSTSGSGGSSTTTSSNTVNPTTSTTSTPPPAPSPTTMDQQISFGVTVAPITDCTSGKAMTEVFFVVSDPAGGSFRLTSDNGIKDAPLEWGRYPFQNGKYNWKAVSNSGYAITGDASGYFQLSGTCATSVVATTSATTTAAQGGGVTATADAFPLKYPELSSVVPIITVDNAKVASGATISGLATFDVITKGSTRTVFVYEDASGAKQFIGKELGVTHKDGTDEWSVLWSTTNMKDGTYSLAALFDTTAGTMISKRVTFSVKNAQPDTSGATAIKRPLLKLFLNNIAVSSGGTIDPGAKLELRVGAPSAKKVNFYALYPTAASPLEIGTGVIDDLLSGTKEDVWTTLWDTAKAKPGTYKVFVRVLSTDGTSIESVPIPVTLLPTIALTTTATDTAEKSGTTSKKEEERALVARILAPSACATPDECALYCKSDAASGTCKSFARAEIREEETTASLAAFVVGVCALPPSFVTKETASFA